MGNKEKLYKEYVIENLYNFRLIELRDKVMLFRKKKLLVRVIFFYF